MDEYFDWKFYTNFYSDLANMNEEQAKYHFVKYGRDEGRVYNNLCFRENFVDFVKGVGTQILEIGPFNSPLFSGKTVQYFDVLDSCGLIKRAKKLGLPTEKIPQKIDYVSDVGDFKIVQSKFDVIFSCHSVEHQPDLISFISHGLSILNESGIFAFIIPDKRFCFDHYLPETELCSVIAAHFNTNRVHTLESLLRHRLMTTHNDPARHWRDDHGEIALTKELFESTLQEWKTNTNNYVDVHAWQFTPQSWSAILNQLKDLGFINFESSLVFPTPRNMLEFCCILVK